ncbi:hypothetical protein RUM44_010167 [Polyplax serrata]|uniref:DnaJ homolog subfamily C member 22 n=1 Tax=Polyplax serrata TaxID=468196 RepID=A0ABR1AUR9_POLSC
MGAMKPKVKSLKLTYFLWLTTGFFGGHHIYLGRDVQGFLWLCTLGGGLGFGWFRDLFCIPRYVAEANSYPRYVEEQIKRLRSTRKPPFSGTRFMGMLMMGYIFGGIVQCAIPVDPVFEYDLSFLNILIPLSCTVGVWLVGNMGQEQGTFWWPLAASYAAYPLSVYVDDETTWFSLMTLASSLAFDHLSKEWRRTPRKVRSKSRRFVTFVAAYVLYLSLITSYLYFNASLTDSDGEEIQFHEAISHFFTSPWWVDLKQSLIDIYVFAQHHGWYEIWREIIDLSDPNGEINAYKVLGVDPMSPQAEITSKWRTLSREFHPDKVKDPDKKAEAQAKFMEIQQAYEILSKIKLRRRSKNRKSQT